MKSPKPHLARALDACWTLSMGLYLGLSAGAVLAVILAFQTARSDAVQARPGAAPYSDARFTDHWPDYVAGAIGNRLFAVAGVTILVLVGLAAVVTLLRLAAARLRGSSLLAWTLRLLGLGVTAVTLALATQNVRAMNDRWPSLYDPQATDAQLADTREQFEQLHQKSERYVGIAWVGGFIALAVTPWCLPIKKD